LVILASMPLYYLNTTESLKEFYTDEVNLTRLLKLDGRNGFARFKSFHGSDLLTGKTLLITKRKTSPSLKIISEWLPTEMVLRRILDFHLDAKSFELEFSNGMIAISTSYGDLVIRCRDEDQYDDIFLALDVPMSVCGLLLCNPCSLYFSSPRLRQELLMGHFKNIDALFQLRALEKTTALVYEKYTSN
jgi:hypothetical protein